MSRSARLMDLLQAFRRRSRAVSAHELAQELEVSVRTIYRDILTLKDQGAPIEGEAGIGYLLRPGFTLPPLMFTAEEVEALILGARWVISRGDDELQRAARNSLAKIAAVLTLPIRNEVESTTLLVAPPPSSRQPTPFAALIRKAIRKGQKLQLEYESLEGSLSSRKVWPFVLGFFENILILAAWCESRQDFRHFRLDHIRSCELTGESSPENHRSLLLRWQQKEGVEPESFDLSR